MPPWVTAGFPFLFSLGCVCVRACTQVWICGARRKWQSSCLSLQTIRITDAHYLPCLTYRTFFLSIKGKESQPRILCPVKISFRNEREIKTSQLNEFIPRNPIQKLTKEQPWEEGNERRRTCGTLGRKALLRKVHYTARGVAWLVDRSPNVFKALDSVPRSH